MAFRRHARSQGTRRPCPQLGVVSGHPAMSGGNLWLSRWRGGATGAQRPEMLLGTRISQAAPQQRAPWAPMPPVPMLRSSCSTWGISAVWQHSTDHRGDARPFASPSPASPGPGETATQPPARAGSVWPPEAASPEPPSRLHPAPISQPREALVFCVQQRDISLRPPCPCPRAKVSAQPEASPVN